MKHTRHPEGLKRFGEHLRTMRKTRGLSQEELALRADLELSQISRIERGVINTSLSQVFVIAEALEVDVIELFRFERLK
ncbi:MAG: helix-turn-helix domain-containing protein [Saprospiraceae bacterium]